MTTDEMIALFEKHEGLDRVEPTGVTRRPDLAAFLLLDKLVPSDRDMISAAEHDQFWLDPDLDELAAVITEAEIVVLVQCGVWIDDEFSCLAMFA